MFADDFWILKYRPGGYIAPHTDYQDMEDQEIIEKKEFSSFGNVFAQGVLFFTGTELGGNFVMPLLEIAVNPEPGSLVIWHSTDRQGNFDPRYEQRAMSLS